MEIEAEIEHMFLSPRDQAAFVACDFLLSTAEEGFVDEATTCSLVVFYRTHTIMELVDDLEIPFMCILLLLTLHCLEKKQLADIWQHGPDSAVPEWPARKL